jgi:hypothetical protein
MLCSKVGKVFFRILEDQYPSFRFALTREDGFLEASNGALSPGYQTPAANQD